MRPANKFVDGSVATISYPTLFFETVKVAV